MVVRSVLLAGLLGLAGLGLSASVVIVAAPTAVGAVAGAGTPGLPPTGERAPDQQPAEYATPEQMPFPVEGSWEFMFRSWR